MTPTPASARSTVPPEVKIDILRQLISQEGHGWVKLVGRSMNPTLRVGQRLRVVSCERPQVGDVLLVAMGRHLVTHRVLAKLAWPGFTRFVHAGDAAPHCASLVDKEQIVGRVVTPRWKIPWHQQAHALARALHHRAV